MITRTSLTNKVRFSIVLSNAGLRTLAEAVSETMACAIWKARNEMTPLGQIFSNKLSTKHTRSSNSEKLCQPVPGHPEVASNRLSQ